MNHLIYKALCKQTIVQYKLQEINLDTLITQLILPITIENDYLFKAILLKQLKDFKLLRITILKRLNLLTLFYSYVIKEEYYFQILKEQITYTKTDELIQLTCLFIQKWCNEINNSKDVKWNSIQFVSYWEFFSHSIQIGNSSCIDRNNNSITRFRLLLSKFIKLIQKDTTHLIQKQQHYNVIKHTLLILKDLTILQVSDYDYFIELIATKDSTNNEIINRGNKNDIKENEGRLNIDLNGYQLINTAILNIQLKYKKELNEDNINEIFSLITNEKDIKLINLIKFKNYLYRNN
ncbi:hypothetical protein K502DRAFT_331175 [Neoconidiobolus thromboides FSU 785]|nr:hypothetical protein K502DRAFT_331175 [Neoconidiobolus thromboides FSU 785]